MRLLITGLLLAIVVCHWLPLEASVVPLPRVQSEKPLTFSFPGKSWAIVIDDPGFVVKVHEQKADGRHYLSAENSRTKIFLSITLEQADNADAKDCPPYLQQRAKALAPFGPSKIKYGEIAGMAMLAYYIASAEGMPIHQQNVVACTAKDGVFADIHLSKTSFQPSEDHLFADVLNTTHFSDSPSHAAGQGNASSVDGRSRELFAQGSRYFIDHNFQAAIAPYQAALDLEEKNQQLSKSERRVLVDNLGMAYGITGDLGHSEKIYNAGIARDPEYPGFYYGMACVYAEKDNLEKTMDYLRKAFQLRANVIPGESMPDPAKDDSFQRYMTNSKFRDFLTSLTASN